MNRMYWLLAVLLLASFNLVEAQQPPKVPRIGYLAQRNKPTPTTPDPAVEAFQQGLRDLDYVEGKNLFMEYRYGEGSEERLLSHVSELLQLKVDLIVSPAFQAVRAAQQATKTLPIVMVVTVDPVATGLVKSLALPGGNITGLTRLTSELSGKRLELFKEAVPTLSLVGVLRDTSTTAFRGYEIAARELKIQLRPLDVTNPQPDLDNAFQMAVKLRVNGVVAVSGPLTLSHRQRIAELLVKNRLPSMHERNEEVTARDESLGPNSVQRLAKIGRFLGFSVAQRRIEIIRAVALPPQIACQLDIAAAQSRGGGLGKRDQRPSDAGAPMVPVDNHSAETHCRVRPVQPVDDMEAHESDKLAVDLSHERQPSLRRD